MNNSSVPQPDRSTKVVVTLPATADRTSDLTETLMVLGNAVQTFVTRATPYIKGLVTAATKLVKWLQEQEHSGPTCPDNMLKLLAPRFGFKTTEDEQYEAARRLATQHLSLRYVYLSSPGLQKRWSKVCPAFEAYCREHGLSPEQAWVQLVVPIVYDLVHRDEMRKVPLGSEQQWLSKELRKEVERELLGRTTDQKDLVGVSPLPDPGAPEESVERKVVIAAALAELDPVDRELLVKYVCEGYDCRTLAAQFGMSEAAVWKRMERARGRLRSLLADFRAHAPCSGR